MTNAPVSNEGPYSRDRLDLARLLVRDSQPLQEVIQHATQIAARALNVARVGVWVFSEDHQRLTCLYAHHEPSAPTVEIGELRAHDFPRYLQALSTRRWICAEDAASDEATSELADHYLAPLGITSMLDAPILRGDVLFGVVCHEHIGPKRVWSERDKGFAGSAADILALVFEQAGHLDAEKRLREIEVERRAAQKLETLGKLALGIAHDFNSVLTAIQLSVAGLEREPSLDDIHEIAEELRSAARVGGDLSGALLRFARSQVSTRRNVGLAETVSSLDPLLRLLTRESADLELRLPAAELFVHAAPSDVQQILLNLVSNAQQALEKRGHIVVSVSSDADRAVLAVEDDGRGVPEALQARLFDPLFTTKESGTGWGLATVRALATELGAEVGLSSRPGQGSRFFVRFPSSRP